jgi:hypothetical protein
VTATLLLLLACAPSSLDTGTDPAAEPATAHWMADVFGDGTGVPLGRVLLPGAFNSTSYACAVENGISPDAPDAVRALWDTGDDANRQRVVDWARTQGRSVGEQLVDGIRFVEVNVTVKDGALVTWHSVYGVPLDDVLDELVAFSVAHPEEAIVVTFGLTVDEADYPLLGDALTAPRAEGPSFCDRVYDGPEDAALTTLDALRTRNLVWSPDGALRAWLDDRGDCPLSTGATDRAWSITVSPEGVESTLAASVQSRVPEHLLVNDFVFSLDGASSVFEQAEYIATYDGVEDVSASLGFSGAFPATLIDTYDTTGDMNVFAGAWYQDTDLVEAAIAQNQALWGAAP